MERVRQAGVVALILFAVLVPVAGGVAGDPGAVASSAAVVAWPPSTLVVSEVMTGGASASDEFVEVANQGPASVDLVGLELVYVTSSGSTVSRKAVWTESRPLAPGQRLLVANTAGVFAAASDATYAGGFAATGGAVVLRAVGGGPVDAVGWGDATNPFVEGAAATAPPAGSSTERMPGGAAGNGQDTNDNSIDFHVTNPPSPQSLASPVVPAPGATATPAPTVVPPSPSVPLPSPSVPLPTPPLASPSPVPSSPAPTPSVIPTPTPAPTATVEPGAFPSPAPTQAAAPSPTPSVAPSPTPWLAPTPTPSVSPSLVASPAISLTPTPTLLPTVSPIPPDTTPIASVRALPDGAAATVGGTLTTRLGAVEAGRGAFIQDDTAGIALYLDEAAANALPAGTQVVATGTVDSRYGQRTLRVAESAISVTAVAAVPAALQRSTGHVGEEVEGLRVEIAGRTVGASSTLSDGIALWVDDGSGASRVIVAPDAAGQASVPAGTLVVGVGPVGQRDSSGSGTGGHRVHVTEPADFVILPVPAPTPSPAASAPTPTATPTPSPTESSGPLPTPTPAPNPTASPTAAPTRTPAPTPTPTPTASPSPTPASTVIAIETARRGAIGARVEVEGVVTAEAGLAGGPALVALQDATGAIFARLPDGAPRPPRGARIRVAGTLRGPHGQLEVRAFADGVRVLGADALPVALGISGAQLGESVEGRLVRLDGVADGRFRRVSGGDLSLNLVADDGTRVRLVADAASGIVQAAVADDGRYRLTGIVGQRASRKGALDGYRIWLRDARDITVLAAPPAPQPSSGPGSSPGPASSSGPRPSASPQPSAGSAPTTTSVAEALRQREGSVRIRAVVTAAASLLDASGRRIVVEDDTAAVEILLPIGAHAPPIGASVQVTGTMGRAYGAPRIRAKAVDVLGKGAARAPTVLGGPPGAAHEWRLVRVAGRIVDVRKLGNRWRAELETAGGPVPIAGLDGADVPSSVMVEGRAATIVGIVRRAHPSATDRRYAVAPRSRADVSIGPAGPVGGGAVVGDTTGAGRRDSSSGGSGVGPAVPADPGSTGEPAVVDVDLADLVAYPGSAVRVGGIVVDIAADGFELDDGTATALVVLAGAAVEYLPLIEPGDPLNVVGRVDVRDGAALVVVDDPAGIARVGDLPPLLASVSPPAAADAEPAPFMPSGAAASDPLGLGGSALGIGTLVLISIGSAVATFLRRRRLRRALVARVAARLAAVAAPADDGTVSGSPGAPKP